MASTAAQSQRAARIFRIGLGAAVLGYGAYSADPGAPRLLILELALFALPLLFQFSSWPLARAYALWFGAFLVIQSVLAPVLLENAFYRVLHHPNITQTITLPEGVIPGMTGNHQVTCDERGFRVTPRIDYAHKSGVRIFAIGGATTDEAYLDDALTWTNRLQAALTKELGKPVEVINAGVPGLRTRHHISTLNYVLELHPDIILFLVGVNDWLFDTRSRFGPILVTDTLLGRLARAQYHRLFPDPPPPAVYMLPVKADPYARLRRSLERQQKVSWFPETASQQYLSNLARISDICRSNKLVCVFLTQPSGYAPDAPQELKDRFWLTSPPPDASYTLTFDSLIHVAGVYNRALIDFTQDRHHPLCDLAAQIEPAAENFSDDVHFTLAGSARIAEFVTQCVKPLLAQFP